MLPTAGVDGLELSNPSTPAVVAAMHGSMNVKLNGIWYMHAFFGLGNVFVLLPLPGPLYDPQMTYKCVGALVDEKQGRTYGIHLKENHVQPTLFMSNLLPRMSKDGTRTSAVTIQRPTMSRFIVVHSCIWLCKINPGTGISLATAPAITPRRQLACVHSLETKTRKRVSNSD
jgi:hypothetical protein